MLGWVPGARATPFPSMLIWTATFAVYALAGGLHGRRPLPLAAVWVPGLAMRAVVLPLTPYYSDDIYRYLWDGWVQVNGLNPFLHAPADPAVAHLATPWSHLINHPDVATIYPPAAQLVFAALASIGPSILLFKSAWLLADLATGWLVWRLARRGDGRGRTALLLYLWSPLVVLEVAWSGHMEPLGILPMMAAVLLADAAASRDGGGAGASGRWSGLALGAGVAVKFAPVLALPALARRRGLAVAAIALAVPLLLYLVYAPAGTRLFAGLETYGEQWEFNPGLFRLLSRAADGPWAPRIAAGGIVAGIAGVAAWRRWTLERALLWTIGSALVLSPTLHPWYSLWILPLAVVRGGAAWIVLTGLLFLSYWGRDAYHATGVWTQPGWLGWLVWAPFLLVLLAESRISNRLAAGRQIADGE